ncbi:hypothetical protein C6W10_20925 [Plantactinospora sp. BB1]|nr:hypothetical protein C6W10_20925 [Plantactinospora sp. BB1]
MPLGHERPRRHPPRPTASGGRLSRPGRIVPRGRFRSGWRPAGRPRRSRRPRTGCSPWRAG